MTLCFLSLVDCGSPWHHTSVVCVCSYLPGSSPEPTTASTGPDLGGTQLVSFEDQWRWVVRTPSCPQHAWDGRGM
jgi:hypothetical protein